MDYIAKNRVSVFSWQLSEILPLLVTLFKLRIVALLLLAAFGGAALGLISGGTFSWASMLLLAVTGTLSAAGASAINEYLEQTQDKQMVRTAKRPLATGQIKRPHLVLLVGSAMVLFAIGLAWIFNPALAFWVFMGALIYVGVYTIWLKPRTLLNIVIGGAAGSCCVISGGAAVGVWSDPSVWLLAALLFVWTPVHFWSLALAYREDYATASYPMLPVVVSPIVAARWTALHTGLTAVFGIALGVWPHLNWVYLLPITVITFHLMKRTINLLNKPEKKTALSLFLSSNIYLTIVLISIIISSLL